MSQILNEVLEANHPLVPRDIPIYGYVYHVETGRLVEVPQAIAVGREA